MSPRAITSHRESRLIRLITRDQLLLALTFRMSAENQDRADTVGGNRHQRRRENRPRALAGRAGG
jgi:hypothetical protein